MKSIFTYILFLALSCNIQCQINLDLNLGVSQSSLIRNFDDLNPTTISAPCIGLNFKMAGLGKWSVGLESVYLKKGGVLVKRNSLDELDTHHFQLHYLQNTLTFAFQPRKHWFFQAGGYFAWLFNGKEKVNQWTSSNSVGVYAYSEVEYAKMDFPRQDFGLALGTGFNSDAGIRFILNYCISAPNALRFENSESTYSRFLSQTFYFTLGFSLINTHN